MAVTYIVPPDRALVADAEAIVVATGVSSTPQRTADGRYVTVATLRVERSLSGGLAAGETFTLTELGGTDGTLTLHVPGAPRYEPGARYLIFTNTNHKGERATLSMGLGRFAFVEDTEGHDVLSRAIGDEPIVGIVEGGSAMHVERLRDPQKFIAFIGETLAGKRSDINYDVDPGQHRVVVSHARRLFPISNARADYLMSGNPRWPNPSATFTTKGTQPGPGGTYAGGGRTATGNAMGMWNAGSGNTNYVLGGTTTLQGGLTSPDAENTVLFDDPTGLVQQQRNSNNNQNIAAIGGVWSSGSHSLDGETFASVTQGDVEVGKNLSIPEALFQAVMAHELGHTLGFRHSNDRAPATTSAIMNASVSVTTLQQWDLDAEATVYGAGVVCTPPGISGHPQSTTINAGNGTTLSVTATGTSPTYQWFTGASGTTTNPVSGGTGANLFVTPSTTTSYWVRVTGCTPPQTVNSNAATVTVNPGSSCTNVQSVSISASSTSITSGQSVTLTGSTTGGTQPVTFQWTENGVNVGTNNFQLTRTPTQNTSYQLRATASGCSSAVLSNQIIVNVSTGPSCTNVQSVSIAASSTSITPGQSVTLTAQTTGGTQPLTYQWTENGTSVGTNSFTLTRSPTQNSQYQVQVTATGCTAPVASNSVIVNVSSVPVCSVSTPTATASPNPALPGQAYTLTASATTTIGTVSYSWFKGNSGDTSNPIGTGASVAVAAGQNVASQNYWVRATSTCGQSRDQQVTVTLNTGTCTGLQLCINNARYRITLSATAPNGQTAQGVPLYQSNVFGYFSLPNFTGDAGNPEVFVKVVGPVNGVPWVFYAGLTNLDYTVTVTDTETGQQYNAYRVPPPPSGSTQNIGNFDVAGQSSSQCATVTRTTAQTTAGGSCTSNSSTLCLLNRFRISLTAKDNPSRSNNSGPGTAVPVNSVFGFFTTPTLSGDPNDVQAFVKMVDATSFDDFWVFLGGLTDFEFTMTVTDTVNGRQKIYLKPAGSTCGLNDVDAFTK